MTEPFKLRYVNQLVGAFLLIILVVLFLFVIYLIRAKELFVRALPYDLHITQEQLDGLRTGTEVHVLGQIAGRVTNIRYDNGGSDLRVSLAIKETYAPAIFVDSVVRLRHKLGVGEPFLEILRGPESRETLRVIPPATSARLATFVSDDDRVDQLAQQIERVRQSITNVELAMVPALAQISAAASTTRERVDDSVAPSARKVASASESVATSTQAMQNKVNMTLDRFEASADRFDENLTQVNKTVRNLEQESRTTMEGVRESSTTFRESIKDVRDSSVSAFGELKSASTELKEVAEQSQRIARTLEAETRDLPGLTSKMQQTVGDAQDVADALKRHWLLKRYLRPTTSSRQTSPAGVR